MQWLRKRLKPLRESNREKFIDAIYLPSQMNESPTVFSSSCTLISFISSNKFINWSNPHKHLIHKNTRKFVHSDWKRPTQTIVPTLYKKIRQSAVIHTSLKCLFHHSCGFAYDVISLFSYYNYFYSFAFNCMLVILRVIILKLF